MSVVRSGSAISLTYQKPRPDLARLGIRPGTELFSGEERDGQWFGNAVTFSRNCPPLRYPVRGRPTPDGSRVELRGAKPVLDANCAPAGQREEVLVLELGERDS